MSAARKHQLTSEEGDSRTMPNPRTWFSPVEVRSAAWRADCSEDTPVFFSVSDALGFCFTVRVSTVFRGTFFFLFLLRETAVRWEHIREIGGCCLFGVPTVNNKQKYGTGTCVQLRKMSHLSICMLHWLRLQWAHSRMKHTGPGFTK